MSDHGNVRAAGEFDLIAWFRARTPAHERVRLGIGDDCATLRVEPGAELLVTTDMLMDGRHFQLSEHSPRAVGYKALAVNLSDIAAMAGVPLAAAVSVALPRHEAGAVGRGLFEGMMPLAERFGVALAGGDTNAWDGPLVINVALLGESVPPGPVTRSGARSGDQILVTGPLGGSWIGRHMRPEPRIHEALALHRAAGIHAMIDLSDGLSSDLRHILESSGGLGATLEVKAIPVHEDARVLAARDGRSILDHVLNDGEDFELCLVIDPGDARRLQKEPPAGVKLVAVGMIDTVPGLRLRHSDGRMDAIQPGGFDHLS